MAAEVPHQVLVCHRAPPFPPGWGDRAQRVAKSVVSVVPNPKWLLRNGNPIKVLLVYLSSSGLFITVQMAATFARHSSVLARARRTEAPTPQSLCPHLRGAAGLPAPALPASETGSAACQHLGTPSQAQPLPGCCLYWVFALGSFTWRWHQAFAGGIFMGCLH